MPSDDTELSSDALNELCNILATKGEVLIGTWDSGGDSASLYFEDKISEELQDWLQEQIENQTNLLEGAGNFSAHGSITKLEGEFKLTCSGECVDYENSQPVEEIALRCDAVLDNDDFNTTIVIDSDDGISSTDSNDELLEVWDDRNYGAKSLEKMDAVNGYKILSTFSSAIAWGEDNLLDGDFLKINLVRESDCQMFLAVSTQTYLCNDELHEVELLSHISSDSLVMLAIRKKLGLPLLTEEELSEL